MNQTIDMTDSNASIIGAIIAAVVCIFWAFFSETRHNHGIWVAFLMPLAPIIILVLWIIYIFIKYISYLVFVMGGRRGDHEEFMSNLRVRSGVFLLF